MVNGKSMSDNCPVTHYICGKPCGMLQNAYKNTNLLANKCMFAQKNPSINQLLALQVQF